MGAAGRARWRRWWRYACGLMGSVGEASAFLACGIWCGPAEVDGPWNPGWRGRAVDEITRGEPELTGGAELTGGDGLSGEPGLSTRRSGSTATGPGATAAGTPPGHPERVRPDQPPSPVELLLWSDLRPGWLPDRPASGQQGADRSGSATEPNGDPAGSSPGHAADPTDEVFG